MEEVTSNVTIAVIMDYLACHEVEYSGRKDQIFADCDLFQPLCSRFVKNVLSPPAAEAAAAAAGFILSHIVSFDKRRCDFHLCLVWRKGEKRITIFF